MSTESPVRLVPMTEGQYAAFIAVSTADQARSQVEAGLLSAGEAHDVIARQGRQLLPNGLSTPNHLFYAIETTGSGTQVGGLWLTVLDRRGKRSGFVMDIQIDPEHRRKGYATAAFRAMEDIAKDMGLGEISLNVFGHKTGAMALYRKLGYKEIALTMAKRIGDDGNSIP